MEGKHPEVLKVSICDYVVQLVLIFVHEDEDE